MTTKQRVTGADLDQTVYDMCDRFGLHVAHFPPIRVYDPRTKGWRYLTPVARDGKGWLDHFIIGPRGGIWRETKGDGQTPTDEQKQWIAWLTTAGFNAAVWRSGDLRSGRIEGELRAIADPRHDQSAVHTGATS